MFDIAIIGAGPAGYRAAELLAKQNLSVALIEEKNIGGICLNQGCIPFKSYIHTAKILQETGRLGSLELLRISNLSLNQEQLLVHKNKIVSTLQQSVKTALRHYGVSVFYGRATVIKKDDESISIDINGQIIKANRLIIASGSEEKRLNVPDNVSYNVITSSEMLELSEIPEKICIIGAGAIGLEAASYFCDAGSQVSIIEATDHIGGNIDLEIAQTIQSIFEKKGIVIYTSESIKEFSQNEIKLTSGRIIANLDTVLIAIGRTPRVDSKTCEVLDVKYGRNGIEIDQQCSTTNPKVFACGDVTGKLMLAHTAYYQARVVTDTIMGKHSEVNYSVIPRIIYSDPEVLSVGVSEGTNTKSLPMTYSGKYFAENGKDGARAKMIVEEDKIVGFHMIGNGASELSLAAEMMMGKNIDYAKNLVYAHPTYSEIIGELAEQF